MTAVISAWVEKDIKIGEFLCSHFNIEDGRIYTLYSAYYALLFQEKCNWNAKKKICAVYGEGAVTDRTCQKWFVQFHAGDFSLDEVPESGRSLKLTVIK